MFGFKGQKVWNSFRSDFVFSSLVQVPNYLLQKAANKAQVLFKLAIQVIMHLESIESVLPAFNRYVLFRFFYFSMCNVMF